MFDEPIGEILAEARKRLGKGLKEVEFDTKIRAKYIEALESDNFEILPGSVYTQGFIKTYANYLGIDPQPLLKSYRNRYGQPDPHEILKVSSNIRVEKKQKPAWFIPAVIVGVIVVVFLGLMIWGAIAKNMSNEPEVIVQNVKAPQTLETAVASKTTSTSERRESSTSSSSSTSTTVKPTTTTTIEDKKPKKDGKIDVVVKLTGINGEGSWAKVFVDDEKRFEGVIASGESELFEGDASVRVRIGNAPGIEVMLNGKKISTKNLDIKNGIIDHTFEAKTKKAKTSTNKRKTSNNTSTTLER